MSVKIIIERTFKEPLNQEHLRAIEALRIPAMRQKGYISGETLINYDDPRDVVVVSTWTDIEGFSDWCSSDDRKKHQEAIAPYLETPEKITPFMLGADAVDRMFETIVHDSETQS